MKKKQWKIILNETGKLNCVLQLQNNDNNMHWRAFLGMHIRVLEVVKDKKQTSESVSGGVESCSGRGGIFKLTYQAGGTLHILFTAEFSHQVLPS